MKRLEILRRVNKYLVGFRVPGSDIVPVLVTAQGDATSRLAMLEGDQILIARPETHQKGDSDSHDDEISLAFFVLTPDLGPAYTPELENETYERLAGLASDVMVRFTDDTTHCGLLAGLSLVSADIVPESSLFGGWMGYSIDIILK